MRPPEWLPPDLFVVPDDYNNPVPNDEPWLSFIPFDGFLSGKNPMQRFARTGAALSRTQR